MESGQTIEFNQLPLEIQATISRELRPQIKRIYKDWCDIQADRYYIDFNSWLVQNDIKIIGTFRMKKLSVFNSYVRIEPVHAQGFRLVYTVYLK